MSNQRQKNYETKEVANRLHICTNTLRNKISRGDKNLPPSYRIGRKRLFPVMEFGKRGQVKFRQQSLFTP